MGRILQWKAGGSRSLLDPYKCAEVLDRLQNSGRLNPEGVLKEAENKDSPLHDAFDWDDSEAAIKWRLNQAARLIRALVYVEATEEGAREIRCYVSVKGEGDDMDITKPGRYTPIQQALDNPEHRAWVIEHALKDAERYANKYRDLVELSRIVTAIDNTLRAYWAAKEKEIERTSATV